jgi:hypothetical protein
MISFDERWPRKPAPRRGFQGLQVYAGGTSSDSRPIFFRPLDKPHPRAGQEKCEAAFPSGRTRKKISVLLGAGRGLQSRDASHPRFACGEPSPACPIRLTKGLRGSGNRFPAGRAHSERLLTKGSLRFPRGMKPARRSFGHRSDAHLCRCEGQLPGRRRAQVCREAYASQRTSDIVPWRWP